MQLQDIRSLTFEVTSHCNIRCPQCSRIDWNGELAEFIELKNWNINTILPNLEMEKMSNLNFVKLEGDNGDCIMHPKIVEIVDYVYNLLNRPKILILTNGSLRSADWWFEFGRRFAGRLRVQFSVDGMADTHALYRVGADYNKTIENARAFIAGGGDATRRCLIFKHNQHQLDDIRAESLDVGFGSLQFRPGDLFRFQGQHEWPVYWKGKQTHAIKPVPDFDFTSWDYNHTSVKFWPDEADLNLLCPRLSVGDVAITYKGHLIPCCIYHADMYFMRDFNLDYQKLVGDMNLIDLNLRTLSEIFNDPNYYGHRLESMLASNNRLPKCQSTCGAHIDKKIIQLRSVANTDLRTRFISSYVPSK